MEKSKGDDFKWFGEGFDGFPKTLPEDCVEYTIYFVDSKLKDVEVREELRKIQSAATSLAKRRLKGFIWQRESFQLNLERGPDRSVLRGQTNYGDSVEDEWLIVYILRELSKQFSKAWIQIADTDGQFLLIEAANALPLWLNPEVADHRVWINSDRLLIIPIDKPGGKGRRAQVGSDTLSLKEALEIIERTPSRLLHSIKIQDEAFYRLKNYPQQIADSLHHALVKLPRKLAYVLHENASYVSPAVEAFYLRDPIALRPLQSKNSKNLLFPPIDSVTVSVLFTKVGYAQLKSQHFDAPTAWTGVSLSKGDAKAKARAELGMKLTCAFEMLLSDSQNEDKKAVREMFMLLEDVASGTAHLPADEDIREWGTRDDDDSWLNVNFEDFEKELNGRNKHAPKGAFDDKSTQENLRKMVSRFEDFLNDDEAGVDGAELIDEMDEDDDDDDSSEVSESEESEENDSGNADHPSFDEDEFTKMMREMMGMPPGVMKEMMSRAQQVQQKQQMNSTASAKTATPESTLDTLPRRHESHETAIGKIVEDEDIKGSMEEMEQELRDAGALDLDPTNASAIEADASNSSNGASQDQSDRDAHLAKNMLESFKSQAGMAGPGGNLMGMIGTRLPRDEHQDD